MECITVANKPHAVIIPLPFQSHMNAMLKLAKILHFKGFYITFVYTEFNHQKVLHSRGPDSLKGLPDFRFVTIPDGLIPPSDINATQEMKALWQSIYFNCLTPIRNVITKLNQAATFSDSPPVSCIVADALLSVLLEIADEFAIPLVLLWTASAAFLMSLLHDQLVEEKILIPLKDELNEHLNMPIDFIPGMKNIRLKDLPSVGSQ